ncbi:unnamed protein product [Cuscuta campestris]|uniref:Uncharacterized protein n=1 Tax=Cuscuta campestris TaxID=132261 RepID=A0A484MWP6_9ASTE|nr:unnamed protein product [Cuscuta campestris]VFQ93396.1 unnamed protein product [Cuscuta campestris]
MDTTPLHLGILLRLREWGTLGARLVIVTSHIRRGWRLTSRPCIRPQQSVSARTRRQSIMSNRPRLWTTSLGPGRLDDHLF